MPKSVLRKYKIWIQYTRVGNDEHAEDPLRFRCSLETMAESQQIKLLDSSVTTDVHVFSPVLVCRFNNDRSGYS